MQATTQTPTPKAADMPDPSREIEDAAIASMARADVKRLKRAAGETFTPRAWTLGGRVD